MKLTPNFDLHEFYCNDGTPVPEKYLNNVKELANNLQVLRDELGEPLRINSSYRHPAYNKKIGGKPKSQHLTASAADITAKNYTPQQITDTIERLIKAGKMKQGGIGTYPGFVHFDIRGTKARW